MNRGTGRAEVSGKREAARENDGEGGLGFLARGSPPGYERAPRRGRARLFASRGRRVARVTRGVARDRGSLPRRKTRGERARALT